MLSPRKRMARSVSSPSLLIQSTVISPHIAKRTTTCIRAIPSRTPVPPTKATVPTLPLLLEKAYLLSRVHPGNLSVRQAAHELLEKYMDILKLVPDYSFLDEQVSCVKLMDKLI